MLRKIYKELAAIRDELRAIREELNLGNRMIIVHRPYGAREEVVTVREGLQILDGLEPGGIRSLSCRTYTPVHKSGNEKRFASSKEPMMWRRFELLAEDEAGNPVIERYFDCSNCGRHYTVTVMDREMRLMMQSSRSTRIREKRFWYLTEQ